jgi:hypothetical protein
MLVIVYSRVWGGLVVWVCSLDTSINKPPARAHRLDKSRNFLGGAAPLGGVSSDV